MKPVCCSHPPVPAAACRWARAARRGSVAIAALVLPWSAGLASAAPTVVTLTQVPCQFLESEGNIDRGYRSREKADCEAINSQSAAARLAQARPLQLKAGDYIFRVTNRGLLSAGQQTHLRVISGLRCEVA